MGLNVQPFRDPSIPTWGEKSNGGGSTAAPSYSVAQNAGQVSQSSGSGGASGTSLGDALTASTSIPLHIQAGVLSKTAPVTTGTYWDGNTQVTSLDGMGEKQTYQNYVDDKNTEKAPGTTQQTSRQLGYQPYVIGNEVMADASALGGGGALYVGTDGRIYTTAGQLFTGTDYYGRSYINGQQMASSAPDASTTPTPDFTPEQFYALLESMNIAPANPYDVNVTRRSGQDLTDLENLQMALIGNQTQYTPDALPDVPTDSAAQTALRQALLRAATGMVNPDYTAQAQQYMAPILSETQKAYEDARKLANEDLIARGVFGSGPDITQNRQLLEEVNRQNTVAGQTVANNMMDRTAENAQVAAQIASLESQLNQTPYDNALKRAQISAQLVALENQLQQQTINNVGSFTSDTAARMDQELSRQLSLDAQREALAQEYANQGYVTDPVAYLTANLGANWRDTLKQSGLTDEQIDALLQQYGVTATA